jgi:hypothetical protein
MMYVSLCRDFTSSESLEAFHVHDNIVSNITANIFGRNVERFQQSPKPPSIRWSSVGHCACRCCCLGRQVVRSKGGRRNLAHQEADDESESDTAELDKGRGNHSRDYMLESVMSYGYCVKVGSNNARRFTN